MSAHRIPTDYYDMLANGMATVKDPGAAGTIVVGTKGIAVCEVATAGAEARTLEAAGNLPVGVRVLVVFVTDGGNLTINSDDTAVVLDDAGDVAEFVVSKVGSTNEWRALDVST